MTDRSFSRREFLKTSGMALAGAALAPKLAMAEITQNRKSSKKIRMGIVGGGFGSDFQWHEDPNCIVEAVSDLIPARRAGLQAIYKSNKAYKSLEELIKDKDIDAVAVFTGAPDHVRHAVACMKAGKHVISAVPACMTVDEAEELLDTVTKTGLSYMMAETSYYRQQMISARKFYKEGKFGQIFCTEAEYHHPGLESLFFEKDGRPTWRHGLPPMNYPTHCTAFLCGLTNERLTEVTCMGWGDDSPKLKGNRYKNPFWNETAMFKTDKGNPFRVAVWWSGAEHGTERAQWYGDKMSFFMDDPNGLSEIIIRAGKQTEKDDAGFVRDLPSFEKYAQPLYYQTDMLPETMRHNSGHGGSHTFLTHEFIDALVNERKPAIDIYQALAYTVPGIVAHKSALQGGKQMKIPVYDPNRS